MSFANLNSSPYRHITDEVSAKVVSDCRVVEVINLDGVIIKRAVNHYLGLIMLIIPPAGDHLLFYPFEKDADFCYK